MHIVRLDLTKHDIIFFSYNSKPKEVIMDVSHSICLYEDHVKFMDLNATTFLYESRKRNNKLKLQYKPEYKATNFSNGKIIKNN